MVSTRHRLVRRSASITGAILIASGRVPNPTMTRGLADTSLNPSEDCGCTGADSLRLQQGGRTHDGPSLQLTAVRPQRPGQILVHVACRRYDLCPLAESAEITRVPIL